MINNTYHHNRLAVNSRQAAGLIHAWNNWSSAMLYDGGMAEVRDWRGHLTGAWPSALGIVRDPQLYAAFSFDGTVNSVVNCGTITPANKGNISFWLNAPTPAGTMEIMGRGSNYEVELTSAGLLRHKLGNSPFTTTNAVTAIGWVHISLNWTLTRRELYVNGRLDTTNTTTVSMGTAGTFYLGRGSVGSPYFEGKLHDVRIYNRTLSAGDVFSIYAPQSRWDLWERPFYDVPLVLPVVTISPAPLDFQFDLPAPAISLPGTTVTVAAPLDFQFDLPAPAVVLDGVTVTAEALTLGLNLPIPFIATAGAAVAGTLLYTQTRETQFQTHTRDAELDTAERPTEAQTHTRAAELSTAERPTEMITYKEPE